MQFKKFDDQLAVVAMSRKDAVRVVHQLIDQLTSTGGCGSDAFILNFDDEPSRRTRVAFMVTDDDTV